MGFFLVTLLFTFSLYIFIYSINLNLSDKNETNLYETVSLKANVEPEFDSEGIFWWMLKGENPLKLTNYSNEKKKVKIYLIFQNNPCRNLSFIQINGVKLNFNSEEIEFRKEIILKPYSTEIINVKNLLDTDCRVLNDDRSFGAKLRKWYVK